MKNKVNKPYAMVPVEAITDKRLTGEQLRLYCLILHLSITEGFCWASTETIAKALSTTVRRVGQLIKDLESIGYITRFNQSKETECGRKIIGRRIYPKVIVEWVDQNEYAGQKKTGRNKSVKKKDTNQQPLPGKFFAENKEISSSKEEEEIRKNNNSSSDVVPFTGTTPKAVAPDQQERNTASDPTAYMNVIQKKVYDLTGLPMNDWITKLKQEHGANYTSSEEYLKVNKQLK